MRSTADRLRLRMERDRWDCFKQLLSHVTKHMLTAADGTTYAIGRLLGVLLMLWGLGAPTVIAIWLLFSKQPTIQEWIEFIQAMNLYIPALVAGVVALVTLTSSTEPKNET